MSHRRPNLQRLDSSIDNALSYTYEDTKQIADHIQERTVYRPTLGIICGSGLGGLVDQVEEPFILAYTEIPGFPVSTVPGHEGKLVFGILSGKQVVLMKGRSHGYEGYVPQKSTLPVRVMHMMGVTTLFVTNAAGGINKTYQVGDVMIIKDHVNLAGFSGHNPLVGVNDDRFGPRFPPMSNAYDLAIRKLAKSKAKELGFADFVHEGVYSMMVGPNFETVTEVRMLGIMGIDATGMSTVPEVLVARHCGMRVFGMSLVTNMVVQEYDSEVKANHEEVLETGARRSKDLQKLIGAVVSDMTL